MIDPCGKPVMSIDAAAKILDISRNGAYDAAKRGEIPTIKIGHRIMVISAKLREMIDAQDAPAEPTDMEAIVEEVTKRVLRKIAEALR